MKTALIALFAAAATFGAEPPKPAQALKVPPQSAQKKPGQYKKLGSVTWDLQAHKLNWVVQKGTLTNGEFTPTSEERFEISPDDAIMGRAGELRGFDGEEAVALHELLDTLSLYCAESVVWWDKGQGNPAGTQGLPMKPSEEQPSKPAPSKTTPKPDEPSRVKV